MTRHLKALGLALVAAFALSAMAASAAQAAPHFRAVNGKYPVGVSAESELPTFTTNKNAVQCAKTIFAAKLEVETTVLTVVPTVTNPCTFNNLPVTVTFGKCDYVFKSIEKVGETAKAQFSIGCKNAGEKIEIHIYANKEHTISACTITIPPQEKLESVFFKNNAETTDIGAFGTVEGIEFTEHGLLCDEEGTHKTGKMDFGVEEAPTTFIGTEPIHMFGE